MTLPARRTLVLLVLAISVAGLLAAGDAHSALHADEGAPCPACHVEVSSDVPPEPPRAPVLLARSVGAPVPRAPRTADRPRVRQPRAPPAA